MIRAGPTGRRCGWRGIPGISSRAIVDSSLTGRIAGSPFPVIGVLRRALRGPKFRILGAADRLKVWALRKHL